jgi:hypothetical protein
MTPPSQTMIQPRPSIDRLQDHVIVAMPYDQIVDDTPWHRRRMRCSDAREGSHQSYQWASGSPC